MTRVAVVAGPDPGHALPALALGAALARRGDEAILVTSPRWAEAAGAAGVGWLDLPLLAPVDDDLDAGARIHRRAADMAVPLARQLQLAGVDVVVGDVLTACGGLAAELCGLPWVELVPHVLPDPSSALPPYGAGYQPARGPVGRARDAFLRRAQAKTLELARAQRLVERARIGLPHTDPGPVLRLVATLPGLEPPRPDWPGNARVVGPLEHDATDLEVDPPAGRGPLVVVAGSTAATGVPRLVDLVLDGLDGCGVRLVGTDLAPPERVLPSWAVAAPARQGPLLDGAAVAVSGGGHGALCKALLRGVPLVLVPGGGDQKENAARAVAAGAAVVARPDPRHVRDAVLRVLQQPSYAAAARRVAAGAAGLSADRTAALVCQLSLGAPAGAAGRAGSG